MIGDDGYDECGVGLGADGYSQLCVQPREKTHVNLSAPPSLHRFRIYLLIHIEKRFEIPILPHFIIQSSLMSARFPTTLGINLSKTKKIPVFLLLESQKEAKYPAHFAIDKDKKVTFSQHYAVDRDFSFVPRLKNKIEAIPLILSVFFGIIGRKFGKRDNSAGPAKEEGKPPEDDKPI